MTQLMERNGQKTLVLNWKTSFAIFRSAAIPAQGFSVAYASEGGTQLGCVCHPNTRKHTPHEQIYIIHLKEHLSGLIPPPAPTSAATLSATSAIPIDKTVTISKVTYNKFYDLAVEVVKVFPGKLAEVEIYVTDYTANSGLFDYPHPDEKDEMGMEGDTYGYMPVAKSEWPGPYGQMTLKIEAMDPHASYIRKNVVPGMLLFLTNVRIKTDGSNRMEGNLWQDVKYPTKLVVSIMRKMPPRNIHMKAVLERKAKYLESLKKRVAPPAEGDGQQDQKNTNKSKKNREKKARQKARAKETSAAMSEGDAEPETESLSTTSNKHSKLRRNLPKYNRQTDRKIVRCAHEEVKQSTLLEILNTDRIYKGPSGITQTLPFINQNRRALVRVVDYTPRLLEDFTTPTQGSSQTSSPFSSYSKTQRWSWDFFLLIEDARPSPYLADADLPQMWLHVDHKAAEYLLRLDACDLRQETKALAQLREKLAILWGNLEERKVLFRKEKRPYPPFAAGEGKGKGKAKASQRDDELSNLPFPCGVMEYGQKVAKEDLGEFPSGYIRLYSLSSTTIL